MENGGTGSAREIEQFVVGLDVRSGDRFDIDELSEYRLSKEFSCLAQAANNCFLVDSVREIVRPNCRLNLRVGRSHVDGAPAFRPMLSDATSHTRKIVQDTELPLDVTCGRESELDVWCCHARHDLE